MANHTIETENVIVNGICIVRPTDDDVIDCITDQQLCENVNPQLSYNYSATDGTVELINVFDALTNDVAVTYTVAFWNGGNPTNTAPTVIHTQDDFPLMLSQVNDSWYYQILSGTLPSGCVFEAQLPEQFDDPCEGIQVGVVQETVNGVLTISDVIDENSFTSADDYTIALWSETQDPNTDPPTIYTKADAPIVLPNVTESWTVQLQYAKFGYC